MNGKKHQREYLIALAELGLRVTSITKTNSGRLRLQVVAPNGESRPFFVSEHNGDPRAMKNNIAEFRRFADENPPHGMEEGMSLLQNFAQPAPFVWKSSYPVVDTATAPIPSPAPVSAPVAPPAAPAAPIESKTMSSPQKPTAVVIQRLDRKQFHALTKWVVANVAQGREITLTSLAREATKGMGVHVAENTLRDALDLEDIKLAEPSVRKVASNRDRTHVIAGELVRVMRSLGVEPSEELAAIVERGVQ